MNKFSFLQSFHDALSGLSDEHYGFLVRTISEYVFENIEPQLEGADIAIWQLIKSDVLKSVQTSKSRSQAGQASGQTRRNKHEQNETNENSGTIIHISDLKDADIDYKSIEDAWRRHTWRNAHKEYPLEGCKMTDSNKMLVKIRIVDIINRFHCDIAEAAHFVISAIEKAGDPSAENPIKSDVYNGMRNFPALIGDSDLFFKILNYGCE